MNETWLENPAFVVIGISLAACTANEFLAWLFVYRQDRFKYLKSQLLLGEKKLEGIRAGVPDTEKSDGKDKNKKRKEKIVEDQMKKHLQEVNNMKFVNMLVTGLLMFAFYQLLQRAYKGVAVAQLPFEPLPIIRWISHRGLPEGSSPRLVSVMAMRSLVTKVFNHGLRASLANMPTSATAMSMMQENKAA